MSAVPSMASRADLPTQEFGYYLGEAIKPAVKHSLWSPYDQALRVIGPMGSGKTFRFLARTVRQAPGAVLATSTKPDMVELTYGARSRRGPVVSVDPQGVCPGLEPLRWSPVTGAHDTVVADLRASAFVAGSSTGGRGNDDAAIFYRRQASTLLACLLHAAALDGARLRDVLRWASRLDDPAPRAILEHHPGAGPGWADRLTDATTGDDRTVGNTRATLAGALACFQHAEVIDAIDVETSSRATDIEALIEAGGTMYLLGKASEYSSVAPLITAMTEDILDRAEQMAFSQPARRLDPPLMAALDEAPNISPLPSLRQRVADGRGRGLTMIYLLQGWASARARFGKDSADELESFTNNTLVFGGVGDTAWLKELEARCGQVRVYRTASSSGGQRGAGPSRQVSEDYQPVIRAHEIGQLATGKALLLSGSMPPVLTYLPALTEDDDWPQIAAEIDQVRAMADAARARTANQRRARMSTAAATWQARTEAPARNQTVANGDA